VRLPCRHVAIDPIADNMTGSRDPGRACEINVCTAFCGDGGPCTSIFYPFLARSRDN
jgi:hypothetical protein